MAGELQHAQALPIAEQLTQAEYESVNAHILNNGVAEDTIKWDGTKFVRVPKGADGTVLGYNGGVLEPVTPTPSSPALVIDYMSASGVFTVDSADVILVDSSGGPITITLSSVLSATKLLRIKRISDDANDVTIDPWSTEFIEDDTTFVLPGGGFGAIVLVPDVVNVGWWVT